jgi:hypothetical protein
VAVVEQLARSFRRAAAAKDIFEKVHQKIDPATNDCQRRREGYRNQGSDAAPALAEQCRQCQ